MSDKYTWRTLLLEILFICIALLFLYPLFLILMNSFKEYTDILLRSASWPRKFIIDNYVNAWGFINFPRVFLNSFVIAVGGIVGIVILSAMASWRLVRKQQRWSQIIFLIMVSAMVIPFQAVMLPLVQVGGTLGLINSKFGLIIMYWGFGVSFTIFLYHGFVKSIPLEIEESAIIDGSSTQTLFWRIVFPLLKPMTVTVIILNSLWIWNDFLLPKLILQDKVLHTIPIAMFDFFAQYSKKWDMALATLVLSSTPIVVFFLALQKHVIRGIMSGSVKG